MQDSASGAEAVSYFLVFVARSGQASTFNCHLPQMVASASAEETAYPPTRLVGYSKPCEDRLSEALGIPRASSVAVRNGAPNSAALVEFVRNHIPPVEIKWIDEAKDPNYKPLKLNAVETPIGIPKRAR
jgi:ribonuclease P/MRP protein subunit POP3